MNEIFSGTNGQKIGRLLTATLALLALFLLVQVAMGIKRLNYIGKEVYPQRTIQVSGEGEAFAKPDIASFSFSVVEEAKTVAEAQEKAEAKVSKAISTLKSAGVEEKDIKTTNYNFYPKYEWSQEICPLPAIMPNGSSAASYPCKGGKNVLTGYEVNQTMTIKVRKTEQAGDLVTKVGSIGVSNVSNVEFTVDDMDAVVAEARANAIKKAKENAKKLEDQLGIDLGKIIYFNENGNYPIYYDKAMGMGGGVESSISAARPASLPTGESKITSNVSLTYEIR
jgi:uncharacterized protein YggE